MNRYLLFTFDGYYPSGGWNDFQGSFDSIEEAVEFMQNLRDDYAQIADIETNRIVESYDKISSYEFVNNQYIYKWEKL